MDKSIVVDTKLVAACGLYCGACRSYLKGKCPGCAENSKATWCKHRTCIKTHGISSCAECPKYSDPAKECDEYNNMIAKLAGFFLRSDRAACVAQIKSLGLEGHAEAMAKSGR
jgi:hypothetical protein